MSTIDDKGFAALLADLIALGQAAGTGDANPGILGRLAGRPFNRVGTERWDEAVAELSLDELKRLVRGLVLAEERCGGGGSAAVSIYVFKGVRRRCTSDLDSLADWCLRVSSNPWVPFDRHRGECRSLSEYRQEEERKAQRDREVALEGEMREWHRSHERVRQALLQAANGALRHSLIDEMRAFDAVHRLKLIALDPFHPPDFYPAEFFPTDREVLRKVPVALLQTLLAKHSVQKWWGPWRDAVKQGMDAERG